MDTTNIQLNQIDCIYLQGFGEGNSKVVDWDNNCIHLVADDMHIVDVGSCGGSCDDFVVYNIVDQGVGKYLPCVEIHYVWEVV